MYIRRKIRIIAEIIKEKKWKTIEKINENNN